VPPGLLADAAAELRSSAMRRLLLLKEDVTGRTKG
jgi:hypothetical protein